MGHMLSNEPENAIASPKLIRKIYPSKKQL